MLRRGLYVIVDLDHLPQDLPQGALWLAAEALAGGAVALQLRAKGRAREELTQLAREMAQLCAPRGVPLFINDDPQAAADSGAQAVHLGQEDLDDWPIQRVRRMLGAGALVGISSHDLQQARAAQAAGADYVAFGPVYSARTKGSDDAPRGVEMLAEVCSAIIKPVVAIGGIDASNVADIAATGAQMAAVITAVSKANEPRAATIELARAFKVGG
ncbi:MAG: thiamine phosphate synthase [Candidatus Alcyoniella australis]|nr:thiamine phosphate synthase [Candidatus Alcyoniella australis]